MPLRNSIAMAIPRVPGDQKLFERVCYTFILKVAKFQLPTPNSFRAVLKNQLGGKFPPVQNRVNNVMQCLLLACTICQNMIRNRSQKAPIEI